MKETLLDQGEYRLNARSMWVAVGKIDIYIIRKNGRIEIEAHREDSDGCLELIEWMVVDDA